METFKIGDKIQYCDDPEMSALLNIEPGVYQGTISAIYDNGKTVDETSSPYATLITEHNVSTHAKGAVKIN